MTMVQTKPITGPKAWRGAALANDPAWIVTLTGAEVADLEQALATAKGTGRPLAEIGREQFPLTALRPRLQQVLNEVQDGRGFVVVSGLPVDRHSADDVGLVCWGLGRYLGRPLYQNPAGDLLRDVFDDVRSYGNIDVRGYETNAYVPYHTDAGDLVGLLCLRLAVMGGLISIVS